MPAFPRACVGALLALASPAAAAVAEDQQLWLNATVIGTIGPRLAYFAEVQPRSADGARRVGQLLLRPALGWTFSDAVTAYGGYARVLNYSDTAPTARENRLFGQLSWSLGELAGGRLSSRTRIEHRRRADGRDTGWRVREMVRYAHPITGGTAPRALVWEELFAAFNDTDWGARRGFDQARAFAGLEIPLKGAKSTIEVGYLNQTINDSGGRLRMNHVASVTVWVRP